MIISVNVTVGLNVEISISRQIRKSFSNELWFRKWELAVEGRKYVVKSE